MPAIDGYLSHLGAAHYIVGYAQLTFDRIHADLKALSGKHPIITEWALEGKLPGVERGDHYHFSTDGGIDTGPHGNGIGGYVWCDGDNSADDPNGKPRPPVLYTIQQIAAAQPSAYVVVTATPPPPPAATDWQAKYAALVARMEALITTA